jgi:hypothetical protein
VIYTEQIPCQYCAETIAQFKSRYPNINIVIDYTYNNIKETINLSSNNFYNIYSFQFLKSSPKGGEDKYQSL